MSAAVAVAPDLHEAVWTYKGLAKFKGGKLGQIWVDDDGKERAFDKLAAGASVGARYTVWCNADQVVVKGERGPRFKDHRSDDEVIRWTVESRAVKAEHDELVREKKGNAENPYRDLLKPIAEAYAHANWTQRRLILADVIAALGA